MSAADYATLYAFRRNLVVAASAGTGKTHALVGVIVHLLLGASELGGQGLRKPVAPERIVATTFSRKAAAEIRERVVRSLEALALGDPKAAYLRDLEGAFARGGADVDIAKAARRALDGVGRAQIGTLHSFAGSIAREYALELGLSPGFELADEDEARDRGRAAIEAVIGARTLAGDDEVRTLARAAGGADALVDQIEGVLFALDEQGFDAGALAIADDDAAVIEASMREVVGAARAIPAGDKLGPIAGAFARAFEAGRAVDAEAAMTELFSVRKRATPDPVRDFFELREGLRGGTNPEKAACLWRAYAHRDRFVVQARSARALLAACGDEVRRAARASSRLGFGDVLRAARDVLRDHPDVAADLGTRLDVLLVDEFQDTSRLQREIVELLWQRDPSSRAPGASASIADIRPAGLFVVGDRKQSIYGFRGADVGVFAELCVGLAGERARAALSIPEGIAWAPAAGEALADFVSLRENRRSKAEILAFVNAFSALRLRPQHTPAELYEVDYAKDAEDLLVPGGEAGDGGEAAIATRAPRTTFVRVKVTGKDCASRIDEARAVARQIVSLRAETDDTAPARAWKDIAVLAQTNAMLDAVSFALARAGVPYVVAGRGFYAAREVRDLLAMLALVLRPSDSVALLEVLRGPFVGAHDDTLLALADPRRGLVDLGAFAEPARRARISAEDAAALDRLVAVVSRLRDDAHRLGPATILREAVRALELEETLAQLPRGPHRVGNVRKLIELAEREADAVTFLDASRAAAARERIETEAATFSEEDDAVRLLTVHASKGLAFPVVIVPQVGADGSGKVIGRPMIKLLPSDARERGAPRITARITGDDGKPLEAPSYTRAIAAEERRARAEKARLAYVAVSRAADAMVLVGGRRPPSSGMTPTYAATNLAALEALNADPSAMLCVIDDDGTSAPAVTAVRGALGARADVAPDDGAVPRANRPAFRALPIATTVLQDFALCARRFELVHVLGLPERELPPLAVPTTLPEDARIDARLEGTIAHRALERLDATLFGRPEASEAIAQLIERDGIAREHAGHATLVERIARFASGSYAARARAAGATLVRERPFAIALDAGDDSGNGGGAREAIVRGAIDLLVTWPDGSIDVVDYKRPRGRSPEPYAFQLDVYVLAARAAAPSAKIRAGIVFLGGDAAEPVWRESPDDATTRARLASLVNALFDARWSAVFPRAALGTCRASRCGFVRLCHPGGGS